MAMVVRRDVMRSLFLSALLTAATVTAGVLPATAQSIFNRDAFFNRVTPELSPWASPQVLLERLPRNWQGDFTYEGATQAQNYPTGLQVTGYSISGRVLSFAGLLNWGGDRQSEVFGYIDSQTGQIEFYERQNVGPTAESGAGGSFIGFLALPDEQRIPGQALFYWVPNSIIQPTGILAIKPATGAGINR
ncbi:hypothetical protein [Synechococcus elongatus]|uniref:hypothetical protein n=2 Tax=Synechococcus elongatus TaxID=32046 RepID=UPI0030D0152F